MPRQCSIQDLSPLSSPLEFPVQFMLNLSKDNILSVTGKNIRKILTETGHDDIFKVKVSELKKKYKFCAILEENKWKVDVIKELTDVKQGSVYLEDEDGVNFLTRAEIGQILTHISAS